MKMHETDRCVGLTFVWEIAFTYQNHIRRPTYGGMDSEPTGVYETCVGHRHIAAKTEELARAQFNSLYSRSYTITDVMAVCSLDHHVVSH